MNLKYLYVILKFRYIIFASSLYIIEGNFFLDSVILIYYIPVY